MSDDDETATYLGDGAYARMDRFGSVILTTGSHVEQAATNRIVLEPQVYAALLAWMEMLRLRAEQENGT